MPIINEILPCMCEFGECIGKCDNNLWMNYGCYTCCDLIGHV